MTQDKTVLLIDGLNIFQRAYTSNPAMNANGEHIGAIIGFLNMMRAMIARALPTTVIVAWESGGSARRRKLYEGYKANRRPEKLNRFYEDDIPDTSENRTHQLLVLTKLLKLIPITQVYIRDHEADDVIGYLVESQRFAENKKVIMSSDHDMYQLIGENVVIYSPTRKAFVTQADVMIRYGISPRNFALAKAVCGDVSDNIPGVPGVGFKTLAKRFCVFGSDTHLSIDDLIKQSEAMSKTSKVKAYKDIVESRELIERNFRLVDLRDAAIVTANAAKKIEDSIDTCDASYNKIQFIRSLYAEGITSFDVNSYFVALKSSIVMPLQQ